MIIELVFTHWVIAMCLFLQIVVPRDNCSIFRQVAAGRANGLSKSGREILHTENEPSTYVRGLTVIPNQSVRYVDRAEEVAFRVEIR
jgi:hypothetical protein